MLRLLILAPGLLLLAACAGPGKDITRCGKGVYTASGSPDHPFGNYVKTSRNVAFSRAHNFCQSKRKEVFVDNIKDGLPTHVTFRCLEPDDPALQQPKYEFAPVGALNPPCD